jgi:hypothetical protein
VIASGSEFRSPPPPAFRSNSAGASAQSCPSGSGSVLSNAAITSLIVAPSNGPRPASISYSITPRLKMSVRRSTLSPRACSGDI